MSLAVRPLREQASPSQPGGPSEWSARRAVLVVFISALVVRVFIAVALLSAFSGTLVLDDTTYHAMAADQALERTDHWDVYTHQLYWSTAAFMVPVTFLYEIFGPHAIVAQLFVAVMGSLTAVFVTLAARELMPLRWAIVAGLIVALFPSQAFWSSMLMKDASVWFALSGLAASGLVARRVTGPRLLLFLSSSAVFLVILSYLRLHTLVVASWAFVIAMLFSRRDGWTPRVTGAVAMALTVPWVFGAIGPGGFTLVSNAGSLEDRRFANAQDAATAIVDPADEAIAVEDVLPPDARSLPVERQRELLSAEAQRLQEIDPARAEAVRVLASRIERTGDDGISVQEPPRVQPVPIPSDELLDPDIAHLPRGLSVMLFEPFPIPFEGSLSLRLARVESLVWYPLLIFAALGLWQMRRSVAALAFPLLAAGGIVIIYALTEGNVGTAHRHRGEFVWVIALLAAHGAAKLFSRRSQQA